MNTNYSLTHALGLLLGIAACLTSCEVHFDDESNGNGNTTATTEAFITGTWYFDESPSGISYMELASQGTMVVEKHYADGSTEKISGSWRLTNDVFVETVQDEEKHFEVAKLTPQALVLVAVGDQGTRLAFHR